MILGRYPNELTVSPIVGSALVGIAQLVGCLFAPFLLGVAGMRSIFIGGQVLMGLCLMTVGFAVQGTDQSITLYSILLFLVIYQATQGSYFWSYAASVSCDTSNSLASIVLWTSVLIMATCAHLFFGGLGNAGTFFLFSFFCCMGGMIFMCTLKEIVGLSR